VQAAPCPHGPELRFLQDYDDVTIAAGPEVTSLPPEVRVTMVSDPLTDGWYVGTSNTRTYPMLIVCPNCSTSYTIEPGSLGSAGRTVRCARCKTTWFADTSPAEVTALADGAIDESDAHESPGVIRPDRVPDHAWVDMEPAQESAVAPDEPTPEPAESPAPMPAAIADAPSLVPGIEPASSDLAAGSESDEIENFTARRKRLQARRSSRWTALILVLFAFNVALIGARSEVVRFFPQTASLFSAVGLPVNLRNLKFENMRISKEAQEGLSSLVVEGTIVSVANKPTEVPRLRFAARDDAGQEVYAWTALPGRSILSPGEKLDFRSRFVSPPENAVDVMVRFSSAQDTAPGAK
jgi:predicted Zn finger-like uncharacterized protein